jgi:hypothetical protein
LPDAFSGYGRGLKAAGRFSERRSFMVRNIMGLLAVLFFAVSLSGAAQEGKDGQKEPKEPKYDTLVIGAFESYKKETLTLLVDKKEGEKVKKEEQEFKVPGDTPVGYSDGKDKQKVLNARVHLKDLKKGSIVTVTLKDKKVLGVGVFVKELPKDEKEDDK